MTFYFSAYSTPLLFGFVQAWLYAILLWIRGYREERLSDRLLGWVLVGLAFEMWMYMLGFGGIEIFWRQLEFFPRDIGFLVPPLIYFYLKSQLDAEFQFQKRDIWHALPFLLHTVYHVGVFAGGTQFVRQWENTIHNPLHIGDLEFIVSVVQQFIYFYWALQLYRRYRVWIKTQFSETDSISFRWYRNFLIALLISASFSLFMTLLDLWLDLNYWQDWWGYLVVTILIYYVSIEGYGQVQSARKLHFRPETIPAGTSDRNVPEHPVMMTTVSMAQADSETSTTSNVPSSSGAVGNVATSLLDLPERLNELLAYMTTEKPYLDPDLSLPDLARQLRTNPVVLSQIINTGTGKNFNDFVNEYRVEEFKRQVRTPANAHLSFLGLALDCGFNSKATFNRAFKKFTGTSPKAFAGA